MLASRRVANPVMRARAFMAHLQTLIAPRSGKQAFTASLTLASTSAQVPEPWTVAPCFGGKPAAFAAHLLPELLLPMVPTKGWESWTHAS